MCMNVFLVYFLLDSVSSTSSSSSSMAGFIKGTVKQFKENKRRRTTHPKAQFITDVGGIAIAKSLGKLFGFGRQRDQRRLLPHPPHALYNTIPAGYCDMLSSKPIKSAVIYGSSMSNSHILPTIKKPHIDNYVHGMGHVHVNRLLHMEKRRHFAGRGMGSRNSTKLILRPSRHRNMPRAGAGGFASAYNRSYKSRLAHDVVVDNNPALSSKAMIMDPLKFAHAKALTNRYLKSKLGKRMSVANYNNARAFLKVNPHMGHKLRTTWYANTAGLTHL